MASPLEPGELLRHCVVMLDNWQRVDVDLDHVAVVGVHETPSLSRLLRDHVDLPAGCFQRLLRCDEFGLFQAIDSEDRDPVTGEEISHE